MNLYNLLVYW